MLQFRYLLFNLTTSLLLLVVHLLSSSSSQKVRWEDNDRESGTVTNVHSESTLLDNPPEHYRQDHHHHRSVKFDSSEEGSIKNNYEGGYDSPYYNKSSRKGGSKVNEVVMKQYFPQQPPFPPGSPSFQFQFNSFPSSLSPPSSHSGGSWEWDWSSGSSSSGTSGLGQNARKPSFVQFPGESLLDALPAYAPTANSHNSNSRRGVGSSVRIDETCQCGVIPVERDSKKLQRIVGGTVSKDNTWPWMVAIAFMGQSKPFWFCGGSLISDKFVLTAAHCLRTIRNFGLTQVKLIMGTNNLTDSKAAVYYSIRAVRPHPLYKSGTEDFDMALLETKEKVNFTSKVAPICLKQDSDTYLNRTVTVAGWGTLQNGDGPPADLREVDLKVVSHDLCEKEYYYNYRTSITSAMLCAWMPGKDSCQGDSGGPLFLKTRISNSYAYAQIGIVSFGPPQCGTTTIPGVYSRVGSATKWIKSVTKVGRFCKGSF